MSYSKHSILFFVLTMLFAQNILAQVSMVCIKKLEIVGHKKTKTSLILNELDFEEGDSIPLKSLMPTIERNERYLINTILFQYVDIKINKWEGTDIYLKISLKEAWYIYPIPQFELADRNFNVWWVQQNRDIRRANLGLWFIWRNLSGYNDLFKAVVQFGYTRKFELFYYLPPMGRKRKFGFSVNALYSDNKEITYTTYQNKQVFYNDYDTPKRQYQRIRGRVRGYYRPTLNQTHRLGLSFLHLTIGDSVSLFNPDFFLDGQRRQRSFNIKYTYTLDHRDIQAYPLNGFYAFASLEKRGVGIFNDINQLQLYGHFGYYMPIRPWLNISTEVKGRINFVRNKIPYYNNRALGYLDDYVRGYQYYVIDGQDYLLFQTDINFKVLDVRIPLFKKLPISYLQELPFKIHLRYHFDFGYVWDQYYARGNKLSNSDLIGTGIGVDLIFYSYNIILQFEYTINKNGENDLYLRYKFNF